MKTFTGRVAVITGGASGIGRAMADRLAREGMSLVLADVDEPALNVAAEELRQAGSKVVAVPTDVRHPGEVRALAHRAIEAFGAVHLVCNNAGVGCRFGPCWEQSEADWEWVLDVNLRGVINGVRTFVPILLRQQDEGHIVNTASLAGLYAGPFMGPYNVSKFGVVALTETLYFELKMIGSRVSASVLCPAGVRTNIINSASHRPAGIGAETTGPISSAIGEQAMERMRTIVTEGMDPAVVADHVFEAVRDDQLYILTHPEHSRGLVWRNENIVNQRNPDPSIALAGGPQDTGEAAG